MSVTVTSGSLPAPRPSFVPSPADALRRAAYQEFLYGIGAPGAGLGRPLRYSKAGGVFRQEFERGLTLANATDAAVEVALERAYVDADGVRRARVTLAPRSAEVLRAA